jgi:hypothetical protein
MGLQVFLPIGDTVVISANTSSARVALTDPLLGSGTREVRVHNTGLVPAFVNFGDGAVVASGAGSMPVGAGATEVFRVSATHTHVAAITTTSAAIVYFTSGQGVRG